MNRSIFALALFASLAACGGQKSKPAQEALVVTDAVVRLPAVAGRPAAAYFTIRGGKTPDRLTAVSSPRAATVELHESGTEGGVMRMNAITGADVPAGGETVFKPGGHHAMVFGIDPAVKPGTMIPLHFIFQSGTSVDVEARTVAAGDDMPTDMHEGH